MAKILQLSPQMANLIAAGEVVERPASVVKELVENSIDAGAKSVTVELQNGGMTLIRVQDDGCGIAPDDAETAFLRHATSKLRRKEDLEAIGTLGFRGEALAATAAVSRIDLLTRTAEDEAGVKLQLEAGKLLSREAAGCPVGTTILVRDLFFNTPARMKFMKTDRAETAAALAAVQKQALAHPECAFRFLADGEEKLRSPGDGSLHAAVFAVLGRQTATELLPVDSSWERVRLTGFVTKPAASRGSRSYEIFFVNGRWVRSKTLTAALEEAYRSRIMAGRFPACVLHLELPLSMVDVNVHPAKTEIKFLNEREAFDCVHYGVLAALNGATGRVAMRLPDAPADNASARPSIGTIQESPAPPSTGALSKSPAPRAVKSSPETTYRQMDTERYRAWMQLMEQARDVKPDDALLSSLYTAPMLHDEVQLPRADRPPAGKLRYEDLPSEAEQRASVSAAASDADRPQPDETPSLLPEAPDWRVIGEALRTYVLVEQGDALLLIDKHAAHERINFERLQAQGVRVTGQQLLVPRSCALDPEEATLLAQNRPLLDSLGYDFDELGDGTLLLRQIPADVAEDAAIAALSEIAQDLARGRRDTPETLRTRLLETIACKAAIKGGWHTDAEELDYLAAQVLTRDDLKTCPHGRPIVVTLTRKQLEKQFKRQ